MKLSIGNIAETINSAVKLQSNNNYSPSCWVGGGKTKKIVDLF